MRCHWYTYGKSLAYRPPRPIDQSCREYCAVCPLSRNPVARVSNTPAPPGTGLACRQNVSYWHSADWCSPVRRANRADIPLRTKSLWYSSNADTADHGIWGEPPISVLDPNRCHYSHMSLSGHHHPTNSSHTPFRVNSSLEYYRLYRKAAFYRLSHSTSYTPIFLFFCLFIQWIILFQCIQWRRRTNKKTNEMLDQHKTRVGRLLRRKWNKFEEPQHTRYDIWKN